MRTSPGREPAGVWRCIDDENESGGSRPLDEAEIVARARQGDAESFEELVRRHQDIAFRVAWTVTHDAEAAKDAAQSGFIKAHYALDRFRPGAEFRPWLLKIVANEARNAIRGTSRRTHYELRLAGDRLQGDAAPSPEGAVIAGLERRALLDVVGRLPPRDQEVIAFRYFHDLSEAEMASAMGCARGTVKSRLSRALRRLAARLDERGPA